ncbi:hypothetical protein PFISCL1PPCAC_28729 [Pristionchus fissidentatus]|uniref:Uncharacterized protein n=1 Tax=Pristionchus fissidentatus TaxID=1538716 RepID=A0AAV5WYY9_9BILA|nr:hypothetical protein PFISCL1PPCAC_28729 [Pristionchus fissidentatus]
MLRTSINRPPAFDLDVRYFHDNRKWRKLLKDERSEKLMGTVQKMAIRSGLIAHDGVCTPIGSFCWGVLPSLLPRLSKLVLCGIVCGCVQAAVSLAIVLSDDTAVIDCSKRMKELKTLVNWDVHSDHLAMMHAYDSRNSDMSIFKKSTINGMERKEKTVWKVLKNLPHPNDVFLSQEKIANDSEQEKRLLLAIAMSLGDRIGYCRASEGQTVSHSFITRDPDDEKEYSFDSYVFAQPNFDSVGVYCEMREREHYKSGIISMAEVSIIPVSIMGAIGNIGGRNEKRRNQSTSHY